MGKSMKSMKAPAATSYQRLPGFIRGVIYGMFMAGKSFRKISEGVIKPDGCNPSISSVHEVVQAGYEKPGPPKKSLRGKPRATSSKLDKAIVRAVYRHRGHVKVTAAYIRKTVPLAKKVHVRTIRRRLSEAGLSWLRRVRKTLVTEEHRKMRLVWADWVLQRTTTTLARWAYSDGCAFYLARSATEVASQMRGALGVHVWRRTDRKDALFHECVGPSAYWKAQGSMIRIWGLLVAGTLCVYVMPEGETMNRFWYKWLIVNRFSEWMKNVPAGTRYVLQDHERALWTQEAEQGFKEIGAEPLREFPKSSQDVNPIEICWRELRDRLYETEPSKVEQRCEFVARLRNAVRWCNANRRGLFLKISSSQKPWARDVQAADGNRTKH
jgi:transposase